MHQTEYRQKNNVLEMEIEFQQECQQEIPSHLLLLIWPDCAECVENESFSPVKSVACSYFSSRDDVT